MKNFFDQSVSNEVIARINILSSSIPANCDKMNILQMLVYCNVTYKLVYDSIHTNLNRFTRFMITVLIKKKLIKETPCTHNSFITPFYSVKAEKHFEVHKQRLLNYINKAQVNEIDFLWL